MNIRKSAVGAGCAKFERWENEKQMAKKDILDRMDRYVEMQALDWRMKAGKLWKYGGKVA
jgi:hypothetical protein